MPLLESLFVFILQERVSEPGFDLNRETRNLLAKAEESLAVIRDFNKKTPLTWIISCAVRNMSFVPRETSGGEDWFQVYRDYWRRRIEFLFSDFLKDRRRRELLNTFRYFLKGQSLQKIEGVQSESNPDGMPVRGAFALSFLLTFYSVVFMPSINKILRPILIDGDFNKKENRVEFAESYNNLIKYEDDIKKFEMEASVTGDYGKRYIQARQDMSSLPVKRRKIQIVLEDAQDDVEQILNSVRTAAINMINLLDGFLGRDTRGKYDILTNISTLAGKGGQFYASMEEAIKQFQMLVQVLDDIEAMEDGR